MGYRVTFAHADNRHNGEDSTGAGNAEDSSRIVHQSLTTAHRTAFFPQQNPADADEAIPTQAKTKKLRLLRLKTLTYIYI